MAASQRKLFDNILPLTENDMAELDHADLGIAQALMGYQQVLHAEKALKRAGSALSAQLREDQLSAESVSLRSDADLLDWLEALFGFQADNVRNQREHVILLLANHMLRTKQSVEQGVEQSVKPAITFLNRKLLENYRKWCAFLGKRHNLLVDSKAKFLELAYPCLFLLIWGEAANLRFMPECLCFIFHNMANELNEGIKLETRLTINNSLPSRKPFLFCKKQSFLTAIIQPIYKAMRKEAHGSKNGTAPHSSWRNYDDMNEFFWSEHCFTQLSWPYLPNSDYLKNVPRRDDKKDDPTKDGGTTDQESDHSEHLRNPSGQASSRYSPSKEPSTLSRQSSSPRNQSTLSPTRPFESQLSFQRSLTEREKEKRQWNLVRAKKMGFKAGFVEQRSFWNIFHSFHRLWIAQFLILQVLLTLAFSDGNRTPWLSVTDRDIQFRLLYVFVTWAALRAVKALLTIILQFTLISKNHKLVALRMVLKLLISFAWIIIFCLLLAQIHEQRVKDIEWSAEANFLLLEFLGSAGVFLLQDILAILLLFMPWLANITERSDSKVVQVLAWWFHTRTYVGRGMHQALIHTLKYTLFWLVILITKISFSYFLQILPMVNPTRQLLKLSHVQFTWFEFFQNHNRFVVACLWAPVILIYLMDIQIWFSIFSALVGATVGLFSHIGEVRTLRQFRLRFPFFARAVTFNLLPEEQKPHDRLRLFRNMMQRCMLRYGLDRPFEQLHHGSPRAWKFACLWNCIIKYLREEDLIDNKEVEWLKIDVPVWDKNHKLVHHWPLVLLSNEIANALLQAKNSKDNDTGNLWRKISLDEYKKSAVQETFYSLKHLLEEAIWVNQDSLPEERELLRNTMQEIETSSKCRRFLHEYKADKIEAVINHVQKLLAALLQKNVPKEAHKISITKALLNLIDGLVRDLPKKHQVSSDNSGGNQSGGHPRSPTDNPTNQEPGYRDNPGGNRSGGQPRSSMHNPTNQDPGSREDRLLEAIQVPTPEDKELLSQLRRLTYLLNTKETMVNVPKNMEAGRRLAFFSNSLFMNMPRSSSVKGMLAFSVLTPYYNEEVLYSAKQLFEKNEDGINIDFYLQQIFPDEWKNREEREEQRSTTPEDRKWISPIDRKWASYRGQTLARTVRGMMYYQRALEVLVHLENIPERENTFARGLDEPTCSSEEKAAARLKFTFVVACQAYQEFDKNRDPRALEIHALLKENPSMRIAYVSEERSEGCKSYHSVLAKYDSKSQGIVKIYEIKLPGPFILGEGKPENQNQAIIFTRGEALQTIDMNQDNYFEEALKICNLLQEFNQTEDEREKPRILGIREHVFTGSVSSLASFMSAQETSFVTLIQRVLANPLRVRMHYGHPDMFDRLWFLTRGGVSKASKAINISEDIYAGFNCTLRGGHVTHKEYIQVGKGRDVGFNQITTFEAKISGGNGEQMLSRDVYRLGHRLDFFRMFSFYYTTVGFYFSSLLMVLAAFAFMWGRVYLGLSGIEEAIVTRAFSNTALEASLNQQMVVQIGVFTSLPMIVENSLELGFTDAAWQFLIMQLQLCSVFYTFSLGTKAYYFGRTLLHGGAIYKPSGRGFVVRREAFVTIYRNHSRSHFIKGVELIILLILYAKYSKIAHNNKVYTLMTISYWFLALTWLLAPFLFNPSGFDWLRTVYDYEHFQEWLWRRKGVLTRAEESWEVWWNEQQDHLNDTGFWGRVTEILMSVRFFLIQYGVVYTLKLAAHNKSILVYLVSWTYVVVAIVVYIVVARAKDKYGATKHIYYRGIQCFVILFVVFVIMLLVELTEFQFKDLFLSMLGFLPTGWGLLCMAAVGKPLLEATPVWAVVVDVARLYELAIGLIVLAPVGVLSWLPGFQSMQTRILFNQAFSRGLHISKLLSGKKATFRGSY